MDDLDVLRALRGQIDPLDDATKDRIRRRMKGRITPHPVRRPRRALRGSLLGIAAALVVASVAAAASRQLWTAERPVAIPAGQISDPDDPVLTPADLDAAVAEFAPAIRLPGGGSFAQWTEHFEADAPPGGLRGYADRSSVAFDMAFVSECQWAQQWLNASARGDQVGAEEAVAVLDGVSEWMRAAGLHDDGYMANLLVRMRDGQTSGIKMFEDTWCPYTGSWGTTPREQDAKATATLATPIAIAHEFLRTGGNAGAFDRSKADDLAPNVFWTSSEVQPMPATPGAVFIAPSMGDRVTLVSVSEAGTQFCAVVTDTGVEHGTTTNDLSVVPDGNGVRAAFPGPVTCSPGGW
jgi:hypothetical protein